MKKKISVLKFLYFVLLSFVLFWFFYLITLFCQGFREEQNRNARCFICTSGLEKRKLKHMQVPTPPTLTLELDSSLYLELD